MRLLNVAKQGAGETSDMQILSQADLEKLHRILLLILDDTLKICRDHGLHPLGRRH